MCLAFCLWFEQSGKNVGIAAEFRSITFGKIKLM